MQKNKSPSHTVYGETGRYPLYIDKTVASLRYWLKIGKMPVTRFPKQALIMPQNSPGRAGSIKECLKSYGFQDVWTQLQSIDSKAIKLAIGVPVHTNTRKTYAEAGMIFLSEQRKLAISK